MDIISQKNQNETGNKQNQENPIPESHFLFTILNRSFWFSYNFFPLFTFSNF
jgi:hypothetical protein